MKITIYELIGLMNDGKAPKKIKIDDRMLRLNNKIGELMYMFDRGSTLSFDYYIENNKLNSEVEVIEENNKIEFKEIEKLPYGPYEFTKKAVNELIENQKKLIAEINKLKDGIDAKN